MEELARIERRWQRWLKIDRVWRWSRLALLCAFAVLFLYWNSLGNSNPQWFHWLMLMIGFPKVMWDIYTGDQRLARARDADIERCNEQDARREKYDALAEELNAILAAGGKRS